MFVPCAIKWSCESKVINQILMFPIAPLKLENFFQIFVERFLEVGGGETRCGVVL
jgi:hypothetical protein